MKDIIEMTSEEEGRLAWIHSNKFTVPELFHKKFMGNQTYRHACRVLLGYTNPDKGFLHTQRETIFQRADYFLTAKAIRALDSKDKMLVRSVKYPIKINFAEKNHDLRVQEIRITFESSSDLKDLFWVSDFEMRSGISPAIKAEFLEGKLDRKKWRSIGYNPNPKGRRTPDGYFEAEYEGQRMAFVLEYEHHPYGEKKISHMADYLKDEFPRAFKLVVSADSKNSDRMFRALKVKIRVEEREKWFISDFKAVMSHSFKGIWRQLNESGY